MDGKTMDDVRDELVERLMEDEGMDQLEAESMAEQRLRELKED